MVKNGLQDCKKEPLMSDVQTAARMADALVQANYRGSLDDAMWTVERKHGIEFGVLWSLRYRKPKDILLSNWRRILSAYAAECERQRQRYEHELEITRALQAGTDAPLVRAAAALGGTDQAEGEA